ncbi:MAG: hypothetical protein GX425_07740 [Peptococcaceae bacterium]|nr:hypothetical protein [Peptococcaceae bacterium]
MSLAATQIKTDVTARLNSLKAQIEKGKAEKARAEANLETYTKQRDEIIGELKSLGVEPENLDAEIARMDQEIEDALAKAEELLKG